MLSCLLAGGFICCHCVRQPSNLPTSAQIIIIQSKYLQKEDQWQIDELASVKLLITINERLSCWFNTTTSSVSFLLFFPSACLLRKTFFFLFLAHCCSSRVHSSSTSRELQLQLQPLSWFGFISWHNEPFSWFNFYSNSWLSFVGVH